MFWGEGSRIDLIGSLRQARLRSAEPGAGSTLLPRRRAVRTARGEGEEWGGGGLERTPRVSGLETLLGKCFCQLMGFP